MTNRIMDASSLLLCIKRYGEQAHETLKTSSTIPLIYYEVGNALRTSAAILHHITPEEAEETLEHIHKSLVLMKLIHQRNTQDSKRILQNSITHDMTYYDSAYLTAAEKHKIPLVTEDKQLAKAAKKANIPTINTNRILNTTP
ncbi:MAG: type II toxin-antitoxin system VapC family toxin [Candidatus Bathyarchaeota archaeon]|nr:type II toxin-antitoxin system VapC family toxin [Candidatus Bathyarchaeota archaeon]